ncbi:MAG: hypothetical protein MZW92_26470 [Comamonadaceae bacterium]|nr:hypothetical protein [Comamonadaceae bacterium]
MLLAFILDPVVTRLRRARRRAARRWRSSSPRSSRCSGGCRSSSARRWPSSGATCRATRRRSRRSCARCARPSSRAAGRSAARRASSSVVERELDAARGALDPSGGRQPRGAGARARRSGARVADAGAARGPGPAADAAGHRGHRAGLSHLHPHRPQRPARAAAAIRRRRPAPRDRRGRRGRAPRQPLPDGAAGRESGVRRRAGHRAVVHRRPRRAAVGRARRGAALRALRRRRRRGDLPGGDGLRRRRRLEHGRLDADDGAGAGDRDQQLPRTLAVRRQRRRGARRAAAVGGVLGRAVGADRADPGHADHRLPGRDGPPPAPAAFPGVPARRHAGVRRADAAVPAAAGGRRRGGDRVVRAGGAPDLAAGLLPRHRDRGAADGQRGARASGAEHRYRVVTGMATVLRELRQSWPPPPAAPGSARVLCVGLRSELDSLAARDAGADTGGRRRRRAPRPGVGDRCRADRRAVARRRRRGRAVGVQPGARGQRALRQPPAAAGCSAGLRIVLAPWNAPPPLRAPDAAAEIGVDHVATTLDEAALHASPQRVAADADAGDTQPNGISAELLDGELRNAVAPMLQRAAEVFDAPVAVIALRDGRGLASAGGDSALGAAASGIAGRAAAGFAAGTLEPGVVDPARHPALAGAPPAKGLAACAALPLRHEENGVQTVDGALIVALGEARR